MNSRLISPSLLRQLFMLGLILIFGYLILEEMLPYLSGILGAITFFLLFRGIMKKMLAKGWKPWVGATIIMISSLIVIIIPIWLIIQLLASKLKDAARNSEKIMAVIKEKLGLLEHHIGIDVMSSINSQDVTSWVSDNVQSLVGSTFNVVMAISIMYFILYYMLTNMEGLKRELSKYLPISDNNIQLISKEVNDIVKSNAIGIPLVAFFQGLVALIGYYIFGVPDPIFWFVVTFVGSMIPFVGTALGIVPVTILLFSQGHNWQAIGILIYGITVVGVTDNVFRIIIQNKLANLHPLITLIGVIIGVPLFGFIGLIFGPLLISLFMLLVKIYRNEYGLHHKKL
ncbi:AI-2E family transporter [Robertkochia solimangrovi]|uniref:AI-2E family transporter n=1 Tax=Robertkochia solimangrovi TaxID=2213046 RepID=UPI00117D668F|nr:AI-2E family transporter [Robertkochia solimangrovi]TRZ44191.1 AI-2E family transporter [Robertkochia solimangrovi]